MALLFLYPLILSIKGFSPLEIGAAWVAFEIALVLGRPWCNIFLHEHGTKKGLILGALMMAAGIILLALFTFFPVIILGRIIQGAGWGLFIVSNNLHNARILPVEIRGLGFGLAGIAPILPQMTFFPLGEWFVLSGHILTVFLMATLACILSSLIALGITSGVESKDKRLSFHALARQYWQDKEIRAILLAGSAFAMLAAPVLPYMANGAKEWGTVGSAFLLPAALTSLIMRLFLSRTVDHLGNRLLRPFFLISCAGLTFSCWTSTTLSMFTGGILYGIGSGLIYPLIFSEIARASKGQNMTGLFVLFNTFIDLVWVVAPLAAAFLAQLVGFGWMLRVISIIIGGCVLFLSLKIWPCLQDNRREN